MLVQQLAAPEFTGIRLYHCHKRETYFLKKDDLCTPELFIKLDSDTLKGVWDVSRGCILRGCVRAGSLMGSYRAEVPIAELL